MYNLILQNLSDLKNTFSTEINLAKSKDDLEKIRLNFLGKKGKLTDILRSLKKLDIEQKKNIGKEANQLKGYITQAILEKEEQIYSELDNQNFSKKSSFDVTLPGTVYQQGSLNPVTIVQKEMEAIFRGMGFIIVDGPEVEDDYYNFVALNIPQDHPARDQADTYWLNNGQVLRTQTSPCQVRAMKQYGAPLKAISPGRCFRNESTDASHENTFFQMEGIMIDKNISVANLVYIMKILLQQVLQKDVKIRLRPGFFPFVEPGFELDVSCTICKGKGCHVCKNSGWMELLPCGMIHPNVLKHGDIDPEEYTGFAFGLGLTRLAMMKYGINDVRVFNSGNLKIMRQFSIV